MTGGGDIHPCPPLATRLEQASAESKEIFEKMVGTGRLSSA